MSRQLHMSGCRNGGIWDQYVLTICIFLKLIKMVLLWFMICLYTTYGYCLVSTLSANYMLL